MATVPLWVSPLSPPSLAGHGSSPKAPVSAALLLSGRRRGQIPKLQLWSSLVCPSWEGGGEWELNTLQVPPQAGNSP